MKKSPIVLSSTEGSNSCPTLSKQMISCFFSFYIILLSSEYTQSQYNSVKDP